LFGVRCDRSGFAGSGVSRGRGGPVRLGCSPSRFRGAHSAYNRCSGQVPGIEPQDPGLIQIGNFFIEVASHRAWIRGVEAQCRPQEFELLRFLCKHPEELLSHSSLLESLWGDPQALGTLSGFLSAVRAKNEGLHILNASLRTANSDIGSFHRCSPCGRATSRLRREKRSRRS